MNDAMIQVLERIATALEESNTLKREHMAKIEAMQACAAPEMEFIFDDADILSDGPIDNDEQFHFAMGVEVDRYMSENFEHLKLNPVDRELIVQALCKDEELKSAFDQVSDTIEMVIADELDNVLNKNTEGDLVI